MVFFFLTISIIPEMKNIIASIKIALLGQIIISSLLIKTSMNVMIQ